MLTERNFVYYSRRRGEIKIILCVVTEPVEQREREKEPDVQGECVEIDRKTKQELNKC